MKHFRAFPYPGKPEPILSYHLTEQAKKKAPTKAIGYTIDGATSQEGEILATCRVAAQGYFLSAIDRLRHGGGGRMPIYLRTFSSLFLLLPLSPPPQTVTCHLSAAPLAA